MKDSKEQLEKQVAKVIELLRKRLKEDPNRPILKTLYNRYDKAQKILLNNEDTKEITIKGGSRAYLDTFSDYMNPLLIEMDRAEELLIKINK